MSSSGPVIYDLMNALDKFFFFFFQKSQPWRLLRFQQLGVGGFWLVFCCGCSLGDEEYPFPQDRNFLDCPHAS